MIIRAFTVTEFHSEISVIVFAESHTDARTVALMSPWFDDAEWIDLRVHREPYLDDQAVIYGRTYLELDTPEQTRLARSVGWYDAAHGPEPCEKCGLHAWSLLPESAIGEAGMCGECTKVPQNTSVQFTSE